MPGLSLPALWAEAMSAAFVLGGLNLPGHLLVLYAQLPSASSGSSPKPARAPFPVGLPVSLHRLFLRLEGL